MDGNTTATGRLLEDYAEGDSGECIRLEDLLEHFKRRAFGVFLLAATLPSLIPLPFGISIFSGVIVALVGVQIALHLKRPWLPGWLRRQGLRRGRLQRIHQRLRRPLAWLAKLSKPRLEWMCDAIPAGIATGLQVATLGLLQSLPIPFTNLPIGCLLLVYCFALIERDGVLMLGAWVLGSGTIATVAVLAWPHL